jgi:RNA polymerase sigma-70 factor (ECF subfamily)
MRMTPSPQELDLLRQAKIFDMDALITIYDRYSPGVYRYAYRLLGSVDQAEDCVSETFARLLNALRAGKGPKAHLQAYLYRIAHNWITDQYRQVKNEASVMDEAVENFADEAAVAAFDLSRISDMERLRKALFMLTEEQRLVTSMHILEEIPNEEIASLMHKPVGAIKALQHRALVKLKSLLEEKESPDA